MIVGIDNGLDGGLCAISSRGAKIVDKIAMPTFQRSKKREIDILAVKLWIDGLEDFTNMRPILAIEEPLAHAKSSQAVRSMALSFGKLVGMAETAEFKTHRISVYAWQKYMLGARPKGQTKIRALEVASTLVPNENWLKNKRCRTPHDGMIDAYLISMYLYQKGVLKNH